MNYDEFKRWLTYYIHYETIYTNSDGEEILILPLADARLIYENGAKHEREACAKVAEKTVCDTHLPTGVKIYGSRAAAAIRARGDV